MINIKNPNAADKIIELERALGWPRDLEGQRWENGLREDIANIQRNIGDQIHIKMKDIISAKEQEGIRIREGWVIYGQAGYDRYRIVSENDVSFSYKDYLDQPLEVGEVVFIRGQCTHMNENEAVEIASKIGFSIV